MGKMAGGRRETFLRFLGPGAKYTEILKPVGEILMGLSLDWEDLKMLWLVALM